MLHSLVFALALLVAVESEVCTNGRSDIICGGRYCPPTISICVSDVCRCKYDLGVASILCGETGDRFTSIYNDPKVNSYDGESTDVVLPCPYLMTHFKTRTSFERSNVECEVKVFTANQRIRGRQFVSGVQVDIQTHGLRQDRSFSLRVDGEASNGQYCFWKNISYRNKLFGKETISPEVQYDINTSENLAIIDSPVCGTTTAFRPADDQQGMDQMWIPGVAVKIQKDVDVEFLSQRDVVAMPEGYTVTRAGPEGRVSVDILTYRAITSAAPQHFKWRSSMCGSIKNVFSTCKGNTPRITKAMSICRFAIEPSPFLACWSDSKNDPTSEKILELYKACIESRCMQSRHMCQGLKNKLNELPRCRAKLKAKDEEILNDNCQFA